MVRSGLTAVLKLNDEIFDFLDDFEILYGFLTRPPLYTYILYIHICIYIYVCVSACEHLQIGSVTETLEPN